MSCDIAIPPEALEAAQRDAAAAIQRLVEPDTRAHELTEDEVGEIVLAACLAMLRSWPGAYDDPHGRRGYIIPPLHKENSND